MGIIRKITALMFIILTVCGNIWLTLSVVGGETDWVEGIVSITLVVLMVCLVAHVVLLLCGVRFKDEE